MNLLEAMLAYAELSWELDELQIEDEDVREGFQYSSLPRSTCPGRGSRSPGYGGSISSNHPEKVKCTILINHEQLNKKSSANILLDFAASSEPRTDLTADTLLCSEPRTDPTA